MHIASCALCWRLCSTCLLHTPSIMTLHAVHTCCALHTMNSCSARCAVHAVLCMLGCTCLLCALSPCFALCKPAAHATCMLCFLPALPCTLVLDAASMPSSLWKPALHTMLNRAEQACKEHATEIAEQQCFRDTVHACAVHSFLWWCLVEASCWFFAPPYMSSPQYVRSKN